jgi:hypothetical protein
VTIINGLIFSQPISGKYNQKGDIYLFVYEYGFLKKMEHNVAKFVLIKWQDYMEK